MGTGFGAVARLAIGLSALTLALGVAGCGTVQRAGEVVSGVLDQVDVAAIQVAATQAMTSVATFVVANGRLPATLAEAGFTPPKDVSVKLVPASGIGFAICASSGDRAVKAENGAVTAVASC